MKDIVISARRQKIELVFLIGSFIIANCLNLWAIFSYGSPIKEMLTSIFYVLAFTLVLYVFSIIFRLVYRGITRSIRSFKKK